MRWGGLVVCAACNYAPVPAAGDGALDTRPGDGPTTDAPDDDDDDDDGVPDVTDNCPATANADQHDEEDDGTGDACDPCPQLDADADGDGDGIGDACDPRPGLTGDTLVHFLPFADGTGLPAGWTSIAGAAANWTVAGDALVNPGVEATKQIMFDFAQRPHSLDIGIEVTQVSGQVDTTGVGAVIEGNGTQSTFYMCFVQTVTSAQFTQLSGPGTVTFASAAQAPTFPGRYRIATHYDGATLRCQFDGANAPPDLVTGQAPLGLTQVGIRMRNTAVRIHYIAIYRSP